jgi:hypothetical protein
MECLWAMSYGNDICPMCVHVMIQGICVGPKAPARPCWLGCSARGRWVFQVMSQEAEERWTLWTMKGEHRVGKCTKRKNRSSQEWRGPKTGCQRSGVVWGWGFYPFSPGHCSVSVLISCAESSILIGCACSILIGHALVLILSLFWSVLLSFFPPFKVTGKS